MAMTVANALRIIQDRAEDDSALAETVLFLAEDADSVDDPYAPVDDAVLAAARLINRRRAARRVAWQRTRVIDTNEVIDLLDSINDRRGVDRRRRRGQLIGWRSGRQTLHPSWQFDESGGRTWPGLDEVIAALAEIGLQSREADAFMTAWRPDLDGTSLADLLASGRVETVVRLIRSSQDQS